MDTTNAAPDQPVWAVIELMGHNRYGGQVSKDNQLGTAMLRVDVPQGDGFLTQLINPASIYRITMCSEKIARFAARQGEPKPFQSWQLDQALLGSTQDPSEDDRDPRWEDSRDEASDPEPEPEEDVFAELEAPETIPDAITEEDPTQRDLPFPDGCPPLPPLPEGKTRFVNRGDFRNFQPSDDKGIDRQVWYLNGDGWDKCLTLSGPFIHIEAI